MKPVVLCHLSQVLVLKVAYLLMSVCLIAFTPTDPAEYSSSPYLAPAYIKMSFRFSKRKIARSYLMKSKGEIIELVRLVYLDVL